MSLKTLSRTVEVTLINSYDSATIGGLSQIIKEAVAAQEILGWKVVSSRIEPELEDAYGGSYARLAMTLSLRRQETVAEYDKRVKTAQRRKEATDRRRVEDALKREEKDRETLRKLKEKYE